MSMDKKKICVDPADGAEKMANTGKKIFLDLAAETVKVVSEQRDIVEGF